MYLPNVLCVCVEGEKCVADFGRLGGSFVLTTGEKLDC